MVARPWSDPGEDPMRRSARCPHGFLVMIDGFMMIYGYDLWIHPSKSIANMKFRVQARSEWFRRLQMDSFSALVCGSKLQAHFFLLTNIEQL